MAVGNHPAGHFSGAPATKRVRGLLAGRRRIAMPALVAALLLFGTAMLPAHASVTRSQIPAASLKLTLKGTVLSGTNQPVAGAIVEAAGKSAWTNAAGRYALVVPLKLTTTGMAWGPGFSVQSFTFTLSFLPKVSTTITVSPFHLDSLFSDPRYGAVLKGLSPVMDGSPATVKVHGRSGIPLDGRLYLEWPNGSVHTSPLHLKGHKFSGDVSFGGRGMYIVEIVAAIGQAEFTVPVFDGVKPFIPLGPNYGKDPADRSQASLDKYAFKLINGIRAGFGLPKLKRSKKLAQAAYQHTADMAAHGYYYTHPHIGSDGSTPDKRMVKAGVKCATGSWGENIGDGTSIANVMDRFYLSPVHLAVFLGKYALAGVGIAVWDGEYLMTVDLCTPGKK